MQLLPNLGWNTLAQGDFPLSLDLEQYDRIVVFRIRARMHLDATRLVWWQIITKLILRRREAAKHIAGEALVLRTPIIAEATLERLGVREVKSTPCLHALSNFLL